ncbi:hypothetical protein AQI95_21270 [Streptomyces yokosukanensis]|uniref:Uncharacterized protein n=1 Tax=Streptomyces yokosukanensis TaxID=67386 RepID=A0A124HFI6_9ACTN|nr:hypothetical protein [Streptomyces yokosukanensis]KUN03972.1 hypothetical protein AQI95_21270 [Streptomyces yokosukanensis]
MNEPRTVTVPTLDHGDVTVPEPDWCTGHGPFPEHRADLTHYGLEHRLTYNGAELFRLMLAQTPLAERASREVCGYVEQAGYTGSLDQGGLYDLAAALDAAADQLRAFADQHAALLAGGAQ